MSCLKESVSRRTTGVPGALPAARNRWLDSGEIVARIFSSQAGVEQQHRELPVGVEQRPHQAAVHRLA